MTFEKLFSDLTFNIVSPQQAYDEISSKEKMKRINYYAHIENISKEPLKDSQLQELHAIVGILQILYNSSIDSPVSDSTYDTLQEMLIDMGIPRLSGSVEINDSKKVSHRFQNLRGTLDKTYYLYQDEVRTNKSRKYLDEWIRSTETLYRRNTGKDIDLNKVKVLVQPKFDGASCILEWNGDKPVWITRGDTRNNRASDVSHIMNIFNDLFCGEEENGQKFEVMISEENKEKINELLVHANFKPYKNSRQVVTATLNSNEADFKADFLYPVPLRIMHPGDEVEQIHPQLIEKFPTMICTFGDRDKIKEFANNNRWININGMRLRTDGAVMTILDDDIKKALGRDNNINNFEVAYKFTEEYAYSKVKRVEFYVSEFGFITPVLVTNDVILKGNTINHISLSNKERFDELGLSYGDEVKVLYDIIPYVTIDSNCRRIQHGRKIKFVDKCPRCRADLDLTKVQVQCTNPECPSRIVGRIMNYCSNLRIQNIGYQTLDTLYSMGLLKHGIRSLYKLRKKTAEIENLEGFGKLKTRKIIAEIEAKRKLFDYEFFGSIGIEGMSIKTFKLIFSCISLTKFLNMIELKNFDLLYVMLNEINGIGEAKSKIVIEYFKNTKNRNELEKLLEEVKLEESIHKLNSSIGKVVFSGCRADDEAIQFLREHNLEASDNWINSAKALVIPNDDFESSKVNKAKDRGIKIIALNGREQKDALKEVIV